MLIFDWNITVHSKIIHNSWLPIAWLKIIEAKTLVITFRIQENRLHIRCKKLTKIRSIENRCLGLAATLWRLVLLRLQCARLTLFVIDCTIELREKDIWYIGWQWINFLRESWSFEQVTAKGRSAALHAALRWRCYTGTGIHKVEQAGFSSPKDIYSHSAARSFSKSNISFSLKRRLQQSVSYKTSRQQHSTHN